MSSLDPLLWRLRRWIVWACISILRRRLLASAARLPYTLVAFESPHRLRDTLADMLHALGDRHITALREATKLYEETFRGAISDCLAHFAEPRGEFTLVVEGSMPDASPPSMAGGAAVLRALLSDGVPAREARMRAAAETGLPRREVYRLWLSVRRESEAAPPPLVVSLSNQLPNRHQRAQVLVGYRIGGSEMSL